MRTKSFKFGESDGYAAGGVTRIGQHAITTWPGQLSVGDGETEVSMPCVRVSLGCVAVDVYYAEDGKGVHVQITGPNAEEDPMEGCTAVMLNDADLYEPEDKELL